MPWSPQNKTCLHLPATVVVPSGSVRSRLIIHTTLSPETHSCVSSRPLDAHPRAAILHWVRSCSASSRPPSRPSGLALSAWSRGERRAGPGAQSRPGGKSCSGGVGAGQRSRPVEGKCEAADWGRRRGAGDWWETGRITRCSLQLSRSPANIVDPVRRGGDGADPVAAMVDATTDEAHAPERREILLHALHHAALVLGEEHHAAQGRRWRGWAAWRPRRG